MLQTPRRLGFDDAGGAHTLKASYLEDTARLLCACLGGGCLLPSSSAPATPAPALSGPAVVTSAAAALPLLPIARGWVSRLIRSWALCRYCCPRQPGRRAPLLVSSAVVDEIVCGGLHRGVAPLATRAAVCRNGGEGPTCMWGCFLVLIAWSYLFLCHIHTHTTAQLCLISDHRAQAMFPCRGNGGRGVGGAQLRFGAIAS